MTPTAPKTPADLQRGEEATIPLDWIVVEPSVSPRRKTLDPGHMRSLVEARKNGKPWPPLTVALVDGDVILVDGFHRYHAAAEAEGGEEQDVAIGAPVRVAVHPEARTLEEARLAAFMLNRETKLPLSKAEREEEGIRRYFEAGKHRLGDRQRGNPRPINQIATYLDIPYSTLHRRLEKLDGGRFLQMVKGDGEEPNNTKGPGSHWQAKRKADITGAGRAIAAAGRQEPEHALRVLEQTWSRLRASLGEDLPATLREHVERQDADPYGFRD